MDGRGAPESRSEVRDGMRIDWNVRIPMDDGLELVADVFRPDDDGRYPVILSYGPYAKGLAFQEAYAPQWDKMVEDFPDVAAGSTNKYQNWEVVDPEKWVPDGYVCLRLDSRGTGMTPGYVDLWSPRETRDIYDAIEWAAAQSWSSGRVGMSGISYYAMNQYQVAALQPPHLVAILPWEGANDWYREFSHHGGILSEFGGKWYPRQVSTVQHGLGDRGARSRITGEPVAGTVNLSEQELAANRADFAHDLASRPLMDQWYLDRNPDWSRVTLPMLSAGNWGGQNLHLRGNVEAFVNAASQEKWLELHGIAHWTHYYTDYGVGLQKRFLAHYLKGEDNGWERQKPVILQVRHIPERYVERHEDAWPIPDTQWTTLYLDAGGMTLVPNAPADERATEYHPMSRGLVFTRPATDHEVEYTGPMSARLFISSQTRDADLFLVVRVFDPNDDEVTFQGALDPNTPISAGWLRASHRKLDPARSTHYRPYRPHDELQPLTPGEVYQLDVEIWPSCIVVPPGYRIALNVRGCDYQYEGELSEFAKTFHYANRGVGPFTHADPIDRPAEVFGTPVTLHTGGRFPSSVLLPVIPPR
jgi:putative CocE/NonD family hydrolase